MEEDELYLPTRDASALGFVLITIHSFIPSLNMYIQHLLCPGLTPAW